MRGIAHSIAGVAIHGAERLIRPSIPHTGAIPRNFLLPQFQTALGTMVHATPVIESLAAALPQARIVVAGSHFAEQIFDGNPHVAAMLKMPSPLQDFVGALRAIRSARPFNGEPYTTLFTSGNERTKIALWALLAGPSRRIGFAVAPELLHLPLQWDPAKSQISNNLRLLSALDLEGKVDEPRIHLSPAQISVAEQRLLAMGSPPGRRRIAVVTQTSPTQRKSWPDDRWIALAQAFTERGDSDLIFVGTAAEAGAIDALRSRIQCPTISTAGQTGIAELAAVFSRCDLGITLDTGPLHVARAVGLPMVIIAPAWSPVHEWLPINDPRYAVLKNADFAAPAPDDYVITEVAVEEVLASAEEIAGTAAGNRASRHLPL